VVKPSGCGSYYLLRQDYTFHCISGRRVSGRSMRGTSFIGGTLIRGLKYAQRWATLGNASVSHHLSSREFRSQISIIKLPPGMRPRRPSYLHNTVVTVRSPPCIVGGYAFRQLNVLPLRCHQCPPVPDYQTETLPSLSQETRRAGNTTDSYSSRYWPGNFLRHGEIPIQSRADLGFAGGWRL
jgi:hypothetical protein